MRIVHADVHPRRTFEGTQVALVQAKERIRGLEKAVLELKAKLFDAYERNRELERQIAGE